MVFDKFAHSFVDGALIGYVLSEQRKERLLNAETAICFDFRDLKHSSILAIKDLKYKDDYIKAMTDTTIKSVNFHFQIVQNGQEVKILKYTSDSLLVKIAIQRSKTTNKKLPYEELWIWERFLSKP